MKAAELCDLNLDEPPQVDLVSIGRHTASEPGRYLLPRHWCLHLYEWHGSVDVGPDRITIRPGSMHLVPPSHPLHYHYAQSSRHLVSHFTLGSSGRGHGVSSMTYQPPNLGFIRSTFTRAVEVASISPQHARALLWTILCELAAPRADEAMSDSRVLAVCQHIDRNLAEDFTVGDLAQRVHLSHNQLTRLFRQHLGQTVVQYVRHRRVRRAKHLLEHSDLPVVAVGHHVGVEDPHQFNKLFRQITGMSPSAFRRTRVADTEKT